MQAAENPLNTDPFEIGSECDPRDADNDLILERLSGLRTNKCAVNPIILP